MEWPYSLNVSLTKEQQADRRRLLDFYGQFAQVSVLLLPLIYQLCLALRLFHNRILIRWPSHVAKDRRSPTVSAWDTPDSQAGNGRWKRFKWFLDDEIAQGWGTWQQLIAASLWASWLLFLVVKDTGDDYLHVTRRFGIVAASQLPVHYILAMKAWNPVQYITRMSHEELNPYHRLLGRIIVIFMACHASLYLNFYIQKGFLLKRIQDRDVILGLSAISSATLLLTATLSWIRDYSYRLFFYLHVALSITILPVLFFHVSHLRLYIIETAAIFILLIVQRNVSQDVVYATIIRYKNTDLLSVSASLRHLTVSRSYVPGQHVYLAFSSVQEKLRKNPFTISNHPNLDRKVELVARIRGGTTSMLKKLENQQQPVALAFEGPYGGAKYFPDFSEYDSVLLLAGGVGATFTLPIYQQLLRVKNENEMSFDLKFVWVVRHQDDAAWGIERLSQDSKTLPDDFELYLTGQGRSRQASGSAAGGISDEIELQEREGLLNDDMTENREIDSITKNRIRSGRPNLSKLVDDAFSHHGGTKVAVLVCGPTGMGTALRKEVGRKIGSGRDVFWHNEEFGW